MGRVTYTREDFGAEIVAPSGYYQPVEEVWIEHDGRSLLYVLGTACIEASCCGVGSWNYVRVEGFLAPGADAQDLAAQGAVDVETVEGVSARAALNRLLLQKYPTARIEFR